MKKLLVWAMGALLTAGAAFADGRNLVAQPNATFAFGVGGAAIGPSTTNNDDSCDISVAPAATLLLPYFEVELNKPATTAQTTLWTITNVSALPQIAHVTIWTDWSFPVLASMMIPAKGIQWPIANGILFIGADQPACAAY